MIHEEINKINKGILFSNQKNARDTKLGFTRNVVANSTKANNNLNSQKENYLKV